MNRPLLLRGALVLPFALALAVALAPLFAASSPLALAAFGLSLLAVGGLASPVRIARATGGFLLGILAVASMLGALGIGSFAGATAWTALTPMTLGLWLSLPWLALLFVVRWDRPAGQILGIQAALFDGIALGAVASSVAGAPSLGSAGAILGAYGGAIQAQGTAWGQLLAGSPFASFPLDTLLPPVLVASVGGASLIPLLTVLLPRGEIPRSERSDSPDATGASLGPDQRAILAEASPPFPEPAGRSVGGLVLVGAVATLGLVGIGLLAPGLVFLALAVATIGALAPALVGERLRAADTDPPSDGILSAARRAGRPGWPRRRERRSPEAGDGLRADGAR